MFGLRVSQFITIAVVAVCGVAVWICSYLVQRHSPIQAVAEAAAEQDSLWARACRGDEEGGDSCAEVIQSKYGVVRISWRTRVQEIQKDDQGKTIKDDQGKPLTKEVIKWIEHPVPVAQLGLCYYIFLGVWFICTGRPVRAARWWHLIPLMLSCLAACSSVYYIIIMAAVLKEWCTLCLILHIIDFLLCPAMVLLWPRREQAAELAPSEPLPVDTDLSFRHFLATFGCIVAVCAISFVHRNGEVATAVVERSLGRQVKSLARYQKEYKRFRSGPRTVVAAYIDTKKTEIPMREGAFNWGDPQAKYEVIFFSDLHCPACRQIENRLRKEFMPLWKGQLKLTFRHFPLCKVCNPRMNNLHPHACEAAYAVEAAALQGGVEIFWSMHALISKDQPSKAKPEFASSKFEEYAAQLGLDVERFRKDMQSELVRQRVQEDIAVGTKLGLTSTPTIYLDGRKLRGSLHTNNPVFWKAIASLHAGGPDKH